MFFQKTCVSFAVGKLKDLHYSVRLLLKKCISKEIISALKRTFFLFLDMVKVSLKGQLKKKINSGAYGGVCCCGDHAG